MSINLGGRGWRELGRVCGGETIVTLICMKNYFN